MNLTQVHSAVIGSGAEHIIFLHGWGHTHRALYGLAELCVDYGGGRFTAHLIDLPGFGESARPPEIWGTPEYSARIFQYLDEKKIQSAIFVGHSFGGRVAAYCAATSPARVQKTILINASGLKRRLGFSARARMFGIRSLRSIVKLIDNVLPLKLYEGWFVRRFASADFKSAGPLRKTFVKIVQEDFSDLFSQIAAPTLLLWGEQDTETPLEVGKRFHGLIRGSQFVGIPERGHEVFRSTGAHLCAFYMRPFLTNSTMEVGSRG